MKNTLPASFSALAVASLLCLLSSSAWAADNLPASDSVATEDGTLKIIPINHATLVLQWKERTICVDPVGGAKAFTGLPKPDLILVTHTHGDHFSKPTLTELAGASTKLVGPPSFLEELPSDLRNRATVLGNGQSAEIVGIKVEAIPAYNLTPERLKFHPKGRDNGYVLTLGGKRVYVSGDTEDIPEMLTLKNIDVAFVCINLPYTMTVDQAARAVRAFKPKVVYPYHCRGSDLKKFKELVGTESGIEVRVRDWYSSAAAR